GGWNRFNPILRFQNASVLLPNRDVPISVDGMAVEIDLVKSVWLQAPVIREISGSIKNLSLAKDSNGQWWLNDIRLGGTGTNDAETSIAALISQFPHYLNLELKQLVVSDQNSGQQYEIDRVQIDLQQHDDSFHFELATRLPEPLGNQLVIKAIVKPDRSLIYLKSSQLELARFGALLDLDTLGLQQAELSAEVWINLVEKQISALNGKLSINQGLLQTGSGNRPYTFALTSRISAGHYQGEWRVSNQIDSLKINNRPLQPFSSEIWIAGSAAQTRIDGWIKDFELSNLKVLDQGVLPAKLTNTLQKSELRGQLSNIWFSLDPGDISGLQVAADVSNIASRPVNGIPGMNNLGGSFVIGKKNAVLEIRGSQMTLDFADQFPAPLEVEELTLAANISLVGSDFLISVPSFEIYNSDLRGTGRLWIEANKADKPFMYLRASFADARGSSAPKYVPLKLMSKKLIAWVNQGIKNADVAHGDLLYHGRLRNIKQLVKNRAGELVVDFQVENAEVLFDRKWPVARDGAGRVIFHNLGVDVALDKVSLEGIDNGSANISIANFVHAEIKIDVEARASTATTLQTWINTPVGRKYRPIVEGFRKVQGSVDARLGILLPISDKKRREEVDIKLKFTNSAVEVPAWGLDLTAINGELKITEKSLTAKAMKANFFGDPIVVGINTDAGNDRTLVRASGNIESRQLLVLLPEYLKDGFSGNSDWQVKLEIANNQTSKRKPIVRINAASEMLNTEVLFPAPFRKSAQSSRLANIQLSIFDSNQVDFNLSYGVNIRAKGTIEADSQGDYRLQRLGLGFSTALRNKTSPGIKIYGSLRQLSLDEWFDYYHARIETRGADAADLLEIMDSIDIEIQSAFLFGNTLTNTYLNLKRKDTGFNADIQSSMLKGRFDIPLQHSPVEPIVAELDYLRLQSSKSDSKSTGLIPQDMFNLRLHSKVLTYDDMVFTDLQLDTRLQDDELTIDKLAFRNNKVLLSSSATWQYTPATKQHRSAANISISGQEFGQTMIALGLGEALQDGEINLDGQLRWSGELLNLDWDSLVGDGRLEIIDGVLKNVDPGSGRIVGLMSLSALPRRFSLDFKDVLLEGLDFDKITGNYKIEGEDLYTTDTLMEGSSAKIGVSGRTGLLTRDYDQTLIIVPRIRHSLPVVGAIAAGTTVGLGLLLLQNLFKDVIDKSVQAEYRVTGSWDDPQVDLVKKVVIEKPVIDK
ncbi:MAG: TIGR02099 family protein, partial [Gammaproteobacteria bacterium]